VFTRKALSIFMHRHTTGNAYLKALLTAPHRFDLDGQPAGDVADEHRAAAKEELERRRQIFLARRAAERGPGPGRGAPAPAAGPRDAAAPPQAGHAGEPAAMPTPGGPQPDRGRRPPRPGHRSPTQAPPAGPEDAARRERAALLRTYEASSLSKANFCTLKRLSEAELDAQLSQARRERDARGAPAQAHRA
jgi:sRNA-binding protein